MGSYRVEISNLAREDIFEPDLSLVTVLAVRKRPPYQYEDLEELLKEV